MSEPLQSSSDFDWKNRTRARLSLREGLSRAQNHLVFAIARTGSNASASALAALSVSELTGDAPGVALPRPEAHIVVRFGPIARNGIDVYVMGGRRRVHRKMLRGGHRVVMARLGLGTSNAAFGVPASDVADQTIALQDLWGEAVVRRLYDRLERASDAAEAASVLQGAIAERGAANHSVAHGRLVLAASKGLERASVNAVADDLGVSERHLRRIFREAVGLSPKTFAKVTRFRRALHAARGERHPGWAGIAAAAGYFDQAHLIGEFRTIAGATPQALLAELRDARAIG